MSNDLILTPRHMVRSEYSHTVMAINIERDLLAIEMDGMPGLAKIDRYVDHDGEDIPKTIVDQPVNNGAFAMYRIGREEFMIPLGTNVGEKIPVTFIGSPPEL